MFLSIYNLSRDYNTPNYLGFGLYNLSMVEFTQITSLVPASAGDAEGAGGGVAQSTAETREDLLSDGMSVDVFLTWNRHGKSWETRCDIYRKSMSNMISISIYIYCIYIYIYIAEQWLIVDY